MLLADQHRRLGGLARPGHEFLAPGPGAPPQLGPAPVEHGRADVSERVGRVAEPGPVPVQAEERVLHHVLGGRAVAEHDDGEPDEADRVCPVQLRDAGGGVGARPADATAGRQRGRAGRVHRVH